MLKIIYSQQKRGLSQLFLSIKLQINNHERKKKKKGNSRSKSVQNIIIFFYSPNQVCLNLKYWCCLSNDLSYELKNDAKLN